ncbi:MAG: carboxypeptidase-like regulatory domain-containing protein [Bacteroidales bacterium]|nr:carboxypeptidase-like regulatory domain-containing protein [Bacteroidales bacterium]
MRYSGSYIHRTRTRNSLILAMVCFSMAFIRDMRGQQRILQGDPLVELSGKATVYDHLGKVSTQIGYMFIYDSQLIDNNREVKIKRGSYPLSEAVRLISGEREIKFKFIENHILLFRERGVADNNDKPDNTPPDPSDTLTVIRGIITDRITKEPVMFGSVTVKGYPYGIVSNLNGEFRLTLPDSLLSSSVKISHLGYITRELPASALAGRHVEIFLDQKIVSLQEIVVRLADPVTTITEMMKRREDNYADKPVYITVYYREGTEYRNTLSLTEAVLQIYKSGFKNSINGDQVKMLKMRNLINRYGGDTLVAKIKSSIHSCLLLDIVRNPPDFLMKEHFQEYNYRYAGITVMDSRALYQFSFEKREDIDEPLYRGDLYIDIDNYALVRADFEIDPDFVALVADQLILRKSRNLDIVPEKVCYKVSYKSMDGIYYPDHIRGDIQLRVRRKGRLFSSVLALWFDMANCHTDTTGAVRFAAGERLPVRDIFSETRYEYDNSFWGSFNVILPEKELLELLGKYDKGKQPR